MNAESEFIKSPQILMDSECMKFKWITGKHLYKILHFTKLFNQEFLVEMGVTGLKYKSK